LNEHVEIELTGHLEYFRANVGRDFRLYATAGSVRIPSTLEHKTACNLIGTQMRGTIRRKPTHGREVKLPDSFTAVCMSHEYEFQPDSVDEFIPIFSGYEDPSDLMPKLPSGDKPGQ